MWTRDPWGEMRYSLLPIPPATKSSLQADSNAYAHQQKKLIQARHTADGMRKGILSCEDQLKTNQVMAWRKLPWQIWVNFFPSFHTEPIWKCSKLFENYRSFCFCFGYGFFVWLVWCFLTFFGWLGFSYCCCFCGILFLLFVFCLFFSFLNPNPMFDL